ncbi:scavenger receptor cysteine-rich type 1 protein M130-like [Chaetodon auriga]|uniref:scavenger receptor cysteine-rich type 1 protein M130-like n=1 Tax=Chaetodon auriga TaxID=39042 RepID=UPI004032FAD7
MDHRGLTVLLWLWSSVAPDDIRLEGGASRCAGRLMEKHLGGWKAVVGHWNWTRAAAVCRQLDCGSAVSFQTTQDPSATPNHLLHLLNAGPLWIIDESSSSGLEISCSDSVRLVNGAKLCSGRLEVRSNQSWSSVCDDDFNQQEAEVVCRELGCGAPSVLHGGLYGDVEAPVWTKGFRCEGHESALLDCERSVRNNCSSGKAAGLTCSGPADVRLVGGGGRCDGMLEMNKLGEWKPVDDRNWNLSLAGEVCGLLDCGSAVSTRRGRRPSSSFVWGLESVCKASSLATCDKKLLFSSFILEITCSDSVRLVNEAKLCSGRLEVRSNQSWSLVCYDDFNQQEAEVVCRELGCGAPSVLHGGLYEDMEAPVWTKGFCCEGHESALLDYPDEVRLEGGAGRCAGRLEVRHHEDWRAVDNQDFDWDLKVTAAACRRLDCGSPVSPGRKTVSEERSVWWINSACLQSEHTLKECVTTREQTSETSLEITCSDSVRLVNGAKLCSGRLEVRSNQSWSSVCDDDFNQQEAEVVCRELGCGAPSVLQGALYGDVEAPVWTKGFRCEGHESALLDCGGSVSAKHTCSSGKAVGLTCSDPGDVRLVGEPSRCAGALEMKVQGEWRPVVDGFSLWDQQSAAAVCRLLDCGSAVSTKTLEDDDWNRPVWWIKSPCVQSAPAPRDCVILNTVTESYLGLEVVCSGFLAQPNVSASPSTDGVSRAVQQGLQVLAGSDFTITCSIEPQYPGGSFQLIFTTSTTAQNYTLPAVNHSAHFLFSAADHTHQGGYRCVYHVHVFSQNVSSESQPLCLTISASLTELMVRLVVLLLGVTSLISAVCLRSQKRG